MNIVLLNKGQIPGWICLLLIGCANVDTAPLEAARDPLLNAFESETQAIAEKPHMPPPEVNDLLLPELNTLTAVSISTPEEPRFDISVFQSNARHFFMGLAADTPHNMIVHPDVKGTISINLKDVTISDVLETVREVYGYEINRTGIGYIVFPIELRTRIFPVDYLNLTRNGLSEIRVTSGQISGTESAPSHPVESNRSGSQSSSISGSLIQTMSKAAFWRELQSALQVIVGSEEGVSVVVNPQSGVVVVRAKANKLREVDRFLAVTQNRIQRQVILEAKILEVELSDGFQSGINWAALVKIGSDTITFGQTGGGTLLSEGLSEIAGNLGNLNPEASVPVDGTATSAFGGAFTAALNWKNFKSLIELLETQGKVHTLSSPRISTLNNQKAIIKVGSDEYFVTDISATTVTGVTTQTHPDITLTPFFSGIALDVTPQIASDGMVTLHIHPSVTKVEDQQKSFTVSGTVQDLPLAFSTVRESDSIVQAKSGQIVIIGGLMQDIQSNDRAGTPWLSRLPFIGGLFRQSREVSRKSELVILLKPWVIDGPETWARSLKETKGRFRMLQHDGL